MKLSLKEKLTDKEMRKFLITNDLVLDGFTGYQYAVCLCGLWLYYCEYRAKLVSL